MANFWRIRAVLKKQIKFPEETFNTSLRPNIVPWEERMEEAHKRKL